MALPPWLPSSHVPPSSSSFPLPSVGGQCSRERASFRRRARTRRASPIGSGIRLVGRRWRHGAVKSRNDLVGGLTRLLIFPDSRGLLNIAINGARRLRKIESTRLHTARAFFIPSFLRWFYFLSKAISAETAFVPLYRIPRYIEYLNPRALTMSRAANLTTSCLSEICPTT